MKCNTYYRVKLAVTGLCSGWAETSQLLYVDCPPVNAGQDVCCGKAPTLGGLPQRFLKYSWSPAIGVSNATASNPTALPSNGPFPITYTLTVTDLFGCSATDSVRLFCGKPSLVLECVGTGCAPMLTAISSAASNVSWSTGANGSEIAVGSNGIYGATASNPCGETTASVTVGSVAMGNFPPLIFPNSFTPNGDGTNDIFKIFQFGIAEGDRPAYNATGYRLLVFDRFGGEHVVAEHENEGCESLYNGQIQWDGSISGNIVQEGVYTWLLKLKNCEHDWSSNLRKHTQKLVCTKYTWPWWCAWSCRKCATWTWQDDEATLGAESVKVVR